MVSGRERASRVARLGGALLGCALFAPLPAAAQPSCLDALVWDGEAGDVATVVAALRAGPLARERLERCEDAEVALRHTAAGYEVRLVRAEREAQHRVADLESVALWVESWMMPVLPQESTAVATPIIESEAAASPPEPEAAESPPGPAPVPIAQDPPVVPLRFAGAALVDGSARGRVAVGAELSGSVRVSARLALGFSLAGQWGPQQASVERRALLATIRAEGLVPLGRARLHLGGGVGVVSAHATRELAEGESREAEAGPLVEALATVAVPLGRQVTLDVGLRVRAFLPDELDGNHQEGEGPMDVDEPDPLPYASLSVTLGLAWEREGFR